LYLIFLTDGHCCSVPNFSVTVPVIWEWKDCIINDSNSLPVDGLEGIEKIRKLQSKDDKWNKN
jgi:hypothetical protein